jgi:O-succinylbenzoate synthase
VSAAAVTHVELRRVHLPLVTPFRTAHGVETARDVLVVRVLGPDTEGWAECVAPAEPTYTAEYVDGAHDVLRRFLVPALAAGAATPAVKGHPMARAALEVALLDADLRAAHRSLAAHLGVTRDRVPAGIALGISGSVPALLDAVERHVAEGYRRVKLKIEPGWDLVPVAAVRARFPELALQVDANGSYTVDDADHLAGLDEFGLLLCEQPLGDDDLAGHAALARRIGTPICLDETITSATVAADAIERGACSVVNLKVGRVGGLAEAVRIHDLCRDRRVALWVGGMLETGLGRALNVALAALPGFTLPGDLSASDRYFHEDLTEPFVLDDGHLAVPAGPGLGVSPRPEVLAATTRSVETLDLRR